MAGGSRARTRGRSCIALASNDLRGVVDVLTLGRRTLRVIQQNYAVSVVVNSGGVAIGALGLLNPVMAAIMHNPSTQSVVLNSPRLLRYQPVLPEAGEDGLSGSARAPPGSSPGSGGG